MARPPLAASSARRTRRAFAYRRFVEGVGQGVVVPGDQAALLTALARLKKRQARHGLIWARRSQRRRNLRLRSRPWRDRCRASSCSRALMRATTLGPDSVVADARVQGHHRAPPIQRPQVCVVDVDHAFDIIRSRSRVTASRSTWRGAPSSRICALSKRQRPGRAQDDQRAPGSTGSGPPATQPVYMMMIAAAIAATDPSMSPATWSSAPPHVEVVAISPVQHAEGRNVHQQAPPPLPTSSGWARLRAGSSGASRPRRRSTRRWQTASAR